MSAPVTNQHTEAIAKSSWIWPDDVLKLAQAKNEDAYLDPLLEAVRRVFPESNGIKVHTEQDPEDATWQNIVFQVGVNGLTARECADRSRQFSREWRHICPYPRNPMFVLHLEPEI